MAGLPTRRFLFAGFLPPKSGARCRELSLYSKNQLTIVFYEAPHRLLNTLRDIISVFGAEKELAVTRELTKVHEELFRGSAAAALKHFSQARVRGEIVLLLAPALAEVVEETVEQSLLRLSVETDLSPKEIVKQVAKLHGVSGSEVYTESLRLQGK
jgi:16S rRNA (cytidine1402-2'-O)-methyltransferase